MASIHEYYLTAFCLLHTWGLLPKAQSESDTDKSKSSTATAAPKHTLYAAVDRYLQPGRHIRQPCFTHSARSAFYAEHPEALRLMLEAPKNPVAEESSSHASEGSSERVGEYFLPSTAVKRIAPKIGLKNMVVADSCQRALMDELKSVAHKVDEGISICYTDDLHSLPAYIRQHKGKIKAYIMDSEDNATADHPLTKTILAVFPDAQVFMPNCYYQLDYYSCSTMTLKILKSCNRLGTKLFDAIDRDDIPIRADGVYRPASTLLPAELLKMAQVEVVKVGDKPHSRHHLVVTEKQLAEEVSRKHHLSLAAYRARYTYKLGDKDYNLAALYAKYRYAAMLQPPASADASPPTLGAF